MDKLPFPNRDRKACMDCVEGQQDREHQSWSEIMQITFEAFLRDNEACFIQLLQNFGSF